MLFDHHHINNNNNNTTQHHQHDSIDIDPMLYESFSNGVFSPGFDQELGFANEAATHAMYTTGQDFTSGNHVGDLHEWGNVDEWAYEK